jgi:hypothetical protein
MANKRYVDHSLLAQLLAEPAPYDFHESILVGADLSTADLRGATFRGAVLIGVLFPAEEKCAGASFDHCIAIGTPLPPAASGYMTSIGYDDGAVPFAGWSPEALPASHIRLARSKATSTRVTLPGITSRADREGPTAEPHEGGIRVSSIGYYDDEVTLTAEHLRTLGFVPHNPEGAVVLEVEDESNGKVTQILCTAISGGQDSTDGEPNHVTLAIKRPGDADKLVRYRRLEEVEVACTLCNGHGLLWTALDSSRPCYDCNGTGKVRR